MDRDEACVTRGRCLKRRAAEYCVYRQRGQESTLEINQEVISSTTDINMEMSHLYIGLYDELQTELLNFHSILFEKLFQKYI